MDQKKKKKSTRTQVPVTEQKIARKICLREVKEPYFKAVYYSYFSIDIVTPALPPNVTQLACLAKPQLKNTLLSM